MKKTLSLHETDEFYYDPEAAERPIRFASKFLTHYEGQWAGQPFTLLQWQEDEVIKPLFGWKRKSDGLRRFRELWLLSAKGAGKTPLLALVGMYMLLADGEPAAHVMSCATDFPQAYLTMDAAKKYIAGNKALQSVCDPKQFEIRARNNSKWTVLSGTAEGKHGFRPSCLLMDEAHEWKNGKLYENLTANMPKRRQPLTLVTTNAGASQNCFAWQLHKRALNVLDGKNPDATLLPVIYEAPIELDWTSEEAARAANPSLGQIVTFDQLEPQLQKARESEEGELRYRRLFLSQWQQSGNGRWLDMAQWDRCVLPLIVPKDAALYVGMDLAESDDLCAVVFDWVTPDRHYVDAKFWLPKAKAAEYQARHSVTYRQWAESGHITLVDEPTISPAVRGRIADEIIAASKTHALKAVCYDAYRADDCVAAIEAAGITCVPVRQGYTVSRGCFELDRRLKELSITIADNPVLRFCADNTEVQQGQRGDIFPVKPGDKDKYAGTRWKKIDGISALVTAMTESRKHSFPAAKKRWKGNSWIA